MGPRASHDVARPEVQRALLADVEAAQGTHVWILEPGVTSCCDVGMLSKGARTFAYPQGGATGGEPTHTEIIGNQIGEFMAVLFTTSLGHDKCAVVENPAPSGRSPMLWDLE